MLPLLELFGHQALSVGPSQYSLLEKDRLLLLRSSAIIVFILIFLLLVFFFLFAVHSVIYIFFFFLLMKVVILILLLHRLSLKTRRFQRNSVEVTSIVIIFLIIL